MMTAIERLTFSGLTKAKLRPWVEIQEQRVGNALWLVPDHHPLPDRIQQRLVALRQDLDDRPSHLLNEATLWARFIFPVLVLAERSQVAAIAQAPLQCTYPRFSLEGIADGVLGWCALDELEASYVVVCEAKRGLEATNPLPQLYGQLLAAAGANGQRDGQPVQEVFGCYTIADIWTFVRAKVTGLDNDRPTLSVQVSREYSQKSELETIVRLLSQWVAHKLAQLPSGRLQSV